ncbi:MAG: SCO family protein [Candidatus Eremiobacteraeota bacterium]|nr:SCO family protein [Candidatus Eremiobacteraeota bacterium]
MSLFRLVACTLAAAALVSCTHAPAAAPIRLTDDSGSPWALDAQRGKAVAIVFGFTHCEDTCPATLAKLTHLAGQLGVQGREVEIAFVTVDPQRDTPGVLHRFVGRFSSPPVRVVGLTGTPAQIDAVKNAYHVWAQRVPGMHKGDGYDVAHSSVIFFVGPSGELRSLHDDDDSDAVLARALREAAT